MIIEIDNVELYFKNKCILNGIYVKVETGKVTSILGRNGSGKSCLMDIIFGVLTPKYKHIRFNGKPILEPLYKTKLISYLPQYNFTPNGMKLKIVFKLFNVDWSNFISKFDSFSTYKNINFNKLSGGERRVVEIYLILKKQAKFILLDEPFTGVAPIYIEQIQQLISEEKKHKALLLTDHRYKEVLEISDTTYLLKNGCTTIIDSIKKLEDYNYISEGSID